MIGLAGANEPGQRHREVAAAVPAANRQRTPGTSDSVRIPGLSLTVILTVQAVLSLRLVWSNTAFSDEALYLWAGRLEWSNWLHHTPLPSFATYFSGAPVVYPVIGAVANSLGGLAAARILSLCFTLGATVLLHGVTRRVFDRHSAVFAAALFAALGSAQYLASFATYDAMALFMLAMATWLGIRAAECRSLPRRTGVILLAAAALVIADATKYATALFDPVVLMVIASMHWRTLGRRAGALSGLLAAGSLAVGITAVLALGGKPYWAGISSTTLSRAQGNWSVFGILFVSAGWVGAVAALSVIGAVTAFCVTRAGPDRLLACTLAAAAFLVPAEQARIQVFTSLFKHVAFGGWFAAAVAGYALATFIRAVPAVKARGALRTVIAAIILMTVSGTMLASNHLGDWANTGPVLPVLDAALQGHPQALAVDDTPTFDYYLQDIEPWQLITSVPWSPSAEAAAIRERKFAFILLAYAAGGGSCGKYDPSKKSSQSACQHNIDLRAVYDMVSSGGYQLIARIPYRTTSFSSSYMLWARMGSRR